MSDSVSREAFLDLLAHMAAAASAYRKHAARCRETGSRARADPFFLTRAADFDKAVKRARHALDGN